ncbi:hypothetical protein DFH06DRAFT_1088205 [Mycena polygramma]|nr:hypothetical protein DFH06DRAFT_1088205 [Mycena polygramma]
MEAYFDNKTNITNARIRTVRDDAPMYAVQTSFAFQGRVRTVLRDENPLPSLSSPYSSPDSTSTIVGAINWKERSFEVRGQRRKYEEVRRKEGGLWRKTRFWCWGKERKEYELSHTHEEWKATLPPSSSSDTTTPTPTIAARFTVPARPHLFTKSPPAVVHLTPDALAEDEVFLLLVFIYEEVKRQERTVRDAFFWRCFVSAIFLGESCSFTTLFSPVTFLSPHALSVPPPSVPFHAAFYLSSCIYLSCCPHASSS